MLAYLAGMGASTFGYRQAVAPRARSQAKRATAGREPRCSETYWRRRLIVLVIGLAAFALAAWGLSRALPVDAGRPVTARPVGSGYKSTSASTPTTNTLPGLAGQRGQPRGPRVSGTSGPSPTPTSARQPAGQSTILPEFCVRSDIVLSVFAGQTESGGGQPPVFDVDVVSTQSGECSFNVGSRDLELEIRRGRVRIWNSADCAVGTGELVVTLNRGVPMVLTISWSGRSSTPGCSGRATPVPAGLYTAYAVDGALRSAPVSFRLRYADVVLPIAAMSGE
jgi:hypothetical protein